MQTTNYFFQTSMKHSLINKLPNNKISISLILKKEIGKKNGTQNILIQVMEECLNISHRPMEYYYSLLTWLEFISMLRNLSSSLFLEEQSIGQQTKLITDFKLAQLPKLDDEERKNIEELKKKISNFGDDGFENIKQLHRRVKNVIDNTRINVEIDKNQMMIAVQDYLCS